MGVSILGYYLMIESFFTVCYMASFIVSCKKLISVQIVQTITTIKVLLNALLVKFHRSCVLEI